MKKLIAILLVSMMAFASVSAEAKRMGGGKSVGQQSSNVSKKQAAPPAQATPPAAAPAPAPAPSRPWGAMLGGLAAGLGLAWLASSLGLGAAFGNILMALLIGVAVMAVIGWFMRKRMNTSNENNLAYQGNNAPSSNMFNPYNQPTRFSSGSMIGSALATTATWSIPSGFDVVGFETAAKQNFVLLQAAWDRADTETLSNMMTDAMLKEMQQQLASRDADQEHRTAVISLAAKLLGIEETESNYIASVEFTGTIQETAGVDPEAFEEVWNMTKSKSAGGWLLAGIQTN
jgi:predicted lipid-binding transport protein (Tim44 family)